MALLSLVAKLGLDKTGFEAGMNSAGRKVSQFGSSLKSQLAGAFGAAAVVAFTKSAITAAAKIADIADRLGVSTDAAQQFSLAAQTSGQDIDFFASAFDKLRIAQSEAMKDGKAGPLGKLGLSLKQIQNLSPQELFEQLAASIDDVNTNTQKLDGLFEVFGSKMGGKVVSMLQDFAAAKQNAFLLSPAEIKAAQQFDDLWTMAIANVKGAVASLATDITSGNWRRALSVLSVAIPGLTPLANKEGRRQRDADIESDAETGRLEKMLLRKQKERKEVEAVDVLVARIAEVEEKNRMAGLTAEQKITEAKEKQLAIAAEIAEMNEKGTGTNAERAAKLLALREQEGIVAALQRGIKPESSAAKDLKFPVAQTDTLGRIGGRIGSGNAVQSELKKHTDELKRLNRRIASGIRIEELR